MKRYFLDAALLIIFLLVMSFHFLPRVLHEVFGIVMLAAAICHLFVNRRWLFNFYRGKWSGRKIFSTLINFSILATFAIIFVTGVCISNHIFNDLVSLELRRNFTVHQLHVSLPYVFMILIGLHIGLHWRELWNRFLNFMKWQKNSVRYKVGCYISIFVTICLGIYGAFLNRVGDRLLMKHIFATPATELSWAEFLILFLATMGIYAIAIYFIDKKFFK